VADKCKGCSLLKPLWCHPDGLQLARIVFTSQIFHKLTCSVPVPAAQTLDHDDEADRYRSSLTFLQPR
jgi:hypothetical protein